MENDDSRFGPAFTEGEFIKKLPMHTLPQHHQLTHTPPGVEITDVSPQAGYLEVTWSDGTIKDCVSRLYPNGTVGNGLTLSQEMEGYWVDPAGGIHLPDTEDDFEDPAAMYV